MSDKYTVTNVNVNLGLKANIGNYNSASFNYGISAAPAEGVDPEEVKAELESLVDSWLTEKLNAIKAKNGQ